MAGDGLRVSALQKGFGAELMSRVQMFPPSVGVEGVRRFVLETVEQAGPNACPPLIVGVGIGGSLDTVGMAAKKALLRPIGSVNAASHLGRTRGRVAGGDQPPWHRSAGVGWGGHGAGGACGAAGHAYCRAADGGQPQLLGAAQSNGRVVMMRTVQAPLNASTVRSMRAGEQIRLTGTIYTARDAAHQRLFEALQRGEELPLPLAGQVIYYVGPAPAKAGAAIGAGRADHERAHGPLYAAAIGAGRGGTDWQGQPI